MNVLLIIPKAKFAPTLPLGPLSIATALNAAGHKAVICDCMTDANAYKKFIADSSSAFRPDIAALSVMSSTGLKHAREIAAFCRQHGLKTVWGGGQAEVYHDLILNSGGADYVSIGDGERSLIELCQMLEGQRAIDDVSGLGYLQNGKEIINPVHPLEGSEFPQLDFSLVDVEKYVQPFFCTKRMVHLYLSKGCPFNCTFCNRQSPGSTRYRVKDFDRVIAEIRELVSRYHCDGIYFYDELWCIDAQTARAFCDKLRTSVSGVLFGCFARIGQYDRETLQYLYDAGCRWILFGIESGSAELREKLNKFIDSGSIYETFRDCREIGIITQASFMVGIPGETEDQLRQTVELALSLPADLLPFQNYSPVRGSALFRELVNKGQLEDFTDLAQLEKSDFPSERIRTNFSLVPVKDLKVVRAFFRWSGFSSSHIGGLSGTEIAKEIILRYTKIIFSGGSLDLSGLAESVVVLADVVFNMTFHPRIRKKYGLYKKNFK